MFHVVLRLFRLEVLFRPLRARKRRRGSHLNRRQAFLRRLENRAFQPLESRQMLYGYIDAQNDPSSPGGYTVLNTTPFTLAAPGVLANDSGGTAPLTPHLETNPAHGTVTLNSDGSFTYTATPGYTGADSFTYFDTDSQNDPSSTATVSLTVYAGTLSDVDQTKLPADTLSVPMQILGTSSGQAATAGNLSLVYHSSTAQPTQTLEQDFQPSMPGGTTDELQLQGAVNGLTPAAAFVNTGNLTQNNPVIRLSVEVDTSSLATGRYADTQSVSTMSSQGAVPISALAGAVNVVNEPTSFTNSTNNTWTWGYDTHGNLLSETLPSGDVTSYTVDALGNRLTMTRPAPNDGTGTVTTSYTRDNYERLTKITFPDNSTETFAYNTIDLPTSVTDEDNHVSQTAYNALVLKQANLVGFFGPNLRAGGRAAATAGMSGGSSFVRSSRIAFWVRRHGEPEHPSSGVS